MDNQNQTVSTAPPSENIPVQNPVAKTPPPAPKSFFSTRIILLIVILLILLGTGGVYLALKTKNTQYKPVPKPVVKITPSTTPTPTPDPTAGWKTYTSTKYGFSFKYPPYFFIAQDKTTVNYTSISFLKSEAEKQKLEKNCFQGTNHMGCISDYLNIGFKILQKPENRTLEEFIKSRPHNADEISSLTPIKLDQFSGLQIKVIRANSLQSLQQIYLDQGKKIFDIYAISSKDAKENIKIFDQILSTFKFLN